MTASVALPNAHRPLVIERLVRWYFLAALAYMAISFVGGLLMALQLINHNPLRGIEYFSPGRWRMIHTNAIAYGFLANAFLGMIHWVVPRVTLRPVLNDWLSYFIFGAWQVVVLGTAVGILVGQAQGVEWGETPVWIDPLAQVGLLLVAINFGTPILQKKGPMYVTLWYFLAAFVWTFLTYGMGNFICEYWLSGSGCGAVAGLFIHDLVGLFVTPLGWGMMYYFVPIILKRPIWSHGLSLVGFWGLAFFYPLTGIHHFLYTPIPMFLQHGAVISTIAVEFVVVTVIVNFMGTVWGRFGEAWKSIPIRWFYTGIFFYGVTCFQCSLQVTLTFQQLIHFTDWVVAHAHLVMLGVFSFWLFGVMVYLFPRLLGREWYSQELLEYHYWLSTVGKLVMFVDLTFAGLFQGWSWAALQPWENSITISLPFWWIRLFAGLAIIGGQLCFWYNLYKTYRAAPKPAVDAPTVSVAHPTKSSLAASQHGQNRIVSRILAMFESKSGVFLIAGIGFFSLAFLANGVVPILMYSHLKEKTVEETIEDQLDRPFNVMTLFKDLKVKYKEPFAAHVGEPTKENLAKLLREGRSVYIGEGCWHCHSQFVRPVSNEERRWGPVSQSWEYQNELQRPVMFGTRRVGPDLIREGGRRSSDWHAAHLFKPNLTSPLSVMPEYPWLFDGEPGTPNRRGLAIIMYMQWLGSWLETYPYYEPKPPVGTGP